MKKTPYTDLVKTLVDIQSSSDVDTSRSTSLKQQVIHCYNQLGFDKAPYFINFGLNDADINEEYLLTFKNKEYYSPHRDIYSEVLVYYCVRHLLLNLRYTPRQLLDIGCGNGSTTHLLHALLKPNAALGIDLTTKQIQIATEFYGQTENLSFAVGDAEKIPIKNHSIDLITNIESSHLYPNPKTFFSNVYHTLSPGGYFALVDLVNPKKRQDKVLDYIIKKHDDLKLVIKKDITKLVAKSIYSRIIENEKTFFVNILKTFHHDYEHTLKELPYHVINYGGAFLKRRELKQLSPPLYKGVLEAFKNTQIAIGRGRKYVHYLIQKTT